MAVDIHSAPQIGYRATGPDENLDWFGLGRTLWRRKYFLLTFVAISLALTAAYVSQLAPGYESEIQVILNDRQRQVVDIDQVLETQPLDQDAMQAQIVLIKSRAMAEKLADRLNLHMLPEFNPALRPMKNGLLGWLNPTDLIPDILWDHMPKAWADSLLVPGVTDGMTDQRRANLLRAEIISNIQRNIDAAPANQSSVITLKFVSSDPELARLGASTLAEIYFADQVAAKQSEARFGRQFLDQETARLRASVAAGEKAIEAYRRKAGLVGNEGGNPVDTQQLAGLTTQLVMSRGERAAAEARVKQVEQLLRGKGGIRAAAQMLDSVALDTLREREIELNRQMSELASEFGDRHPTMVNLRAEAVELERRMRNEVRAIVQRLRDEVKVLESREAALQSNIDLIKNKLSQSNEAEIGLAALEREVEADRELLEIYTSRVREIASQEKAQRPDARIVSNATWPLEPSYPRRPLIFGIALFGALLLGSIAVFGLEKLDNTLRSSEQIDQMIGLPTLGMVPALTTFERRYGSPEDHVLDHPNSPFGEAIRSLRTATLLSGCGMAPRTVLLTSSVPSEGKSSVAMCLARVHACSGRQTLIIDCDSRRPRLHELAKIDNELGLMDVLARDHTLGEVIRRDQRSGASFITAGGVVPDPAALLASDRMRQLLEEARNRYDLVILDSPPILSVSDAQVLAQIADKTVFLVHWGSTRRQDVMMGVKQLEEAGADIAGLVLSRVNVRKHASYGYRDSGYYYDSKYTKYYHMAG